MKKQAFVLTLAILLLTLMVPMVILINAEANKKTSDGPGQFNDFQQGETGQIQAGDYRLSGPYTHKNLTIFLVHGKDLLAGKTFLTLQEALEQKKLVVYETKDVNELSIENLSK
ncbi:MAG: ARPP-1 family domain-containing protein [Pyrinomonadaceae bacterium]